jgi:hypothetical protein
MNRKTKIAKTSISLSSVIMTWGKELAEDKGFADNFSAYVADLIRHDKENSDSLKRNTFIKHTDGSGSGGVDGVRKTAK